MEVRECYDMLYRCYEGLKSILNRITQIFIRAFCYEHPPEEIQNTVSLIETQANLIKLKSSVERSVRLNGMHNEFKTSHVVAKVGGAFVKTDQREEFQRPLALLEKLAWNAAQILGDEAYFAPTGTIRLNNPHSVQIKDGEFITRYIADSQFEVGSYQPSCGVILDKNTDALSSEGFEITYILALIYGMYDTHDNNILVRDGLPVFFDNNRILSPTNDFLINNYGEMFPFRLSLIGDDKSSLPLTDASRKKWLNKVVQTQAKVETLKKYLNDPVVLQEYEDLPPGWFNAEKSIEALISRLQIMEEMLQKDGSISLNDMLYAIYPRLKLYAAIVFAKVHIEHPLYTFKRTAYHIGYHSLTACFTISGKNVKTLKIADFNPTDTLEEIFRKTKEGPYVDYAFDSIEKDFIEHAFVNLIEHKYSNEQINSHMSKLFNEYSRSGLYDVSGVIYYANANLFPHEFTINHKGAYLPPMSLVEFKQFLKDGVLPKAQLDAQEKIDKIDSKIVFCTYGKQKKRIADLKPNETIYVQRRIGRAFVLKRIHKDQYGRVTIEPVDKLKDISDSKIDAPKTLNHKDADSIIASSVPGYYIAHMGNVVLPPMTEDELNTWFDSDRKEYHRLKAYMDYGAIVCSNDELDQVKGLLKDGDSRLIQVIDTSPVKHIYVRRIGKEVLTFNVREKKTSVGYESDGSWHELFEKSEVRSQKAE